MQNSEEEIYIFLIFYYCRFLFFCPLFARVTKPLQSAFRSHALQSHCKSVFVRTRYKPMKSGGRFVHLTKWHCDAQNGFVGLTKWRCDAQNEFVGLTKWRCDVQNGFVRLTKWHCDAQNGFVRLTKWRCGAQLVRVVHRFCKNVILEGKIVGKM